MIDHKLAELAEQQHRIEVVRTVLTKGIAAASAGTVDLGASDAYLSSGDLVKTPDLLNVPLAIAAQAVIYNLPGKSAGHVRLNGAVLAGIYEGTITRWDDPSITAINPRVSLPDLKIVPVYRSDSSGDTFLFTSYLSTGSVSDPSPRWNSKTGYGTTVDWPSVPGELREAAASARPSSRTTSASTRCRPPRPSRTRSPASCR